MSFLNPVNEPVLRFKSTDAGAPQINYNARVAGDVKAVLKSCLVTGYGAKASAGWSITNEVGHVAEFVSTSAAMNDYRLGIDDTSASSTTWYYQYQDVRVNPSYNNPTKTLSQIDKTHASNGWQLFVTERGLIFIEIVQHAGMNRLSTRITYWGQVKSSLLDSTGKNICFFNIGHSAAISIPYYFYRSDAYVHTNLSTYTSAQPSPAAVSSLNTIATQLDVCSIDLFSPIYLSAGSTTLLGELTPLLSAAVASSEDTYRITEITVGGRNALSVCAGYGVNSTADLLTSYSRTFVIYLDYWEY